MQSVEDEKLLHQKLMLSYSAIYWLNRQMNGKEADEELKSNDIKYWHEAIATLQNNEDNAMKFWRCETYEEVFRWKFQICVELF